MSTNAGLATSGDSTLVGASYCVSVWTDLLGSRQDNAVQCSAAQVAFGQVREGPGEMKLLGVVDGGRRGDRRSMSICSVLSTSGVVWSGRGLG